MSNPLRRSLLLFSLLLCLGCRDTQANAEPDHALSPVGRMMVVGREHLHVLDEGQGPAIVYIHGNPGTLAEFVRFSLPTLKARYRTIAWERPGYGLSSRHDGALADPFAQAALLQQALKAMGVSKPVLISHSWATSVALAYADRYPDQVTGLVLTAPLVEPSGPATWMRLPGLPWALAHLMPRSAAESLTKGMLEKAFAPEAMPPDFWPAVQEAWLQPTQLQASLDDAGQLGAALTKSKARLGTMRLPVALIAGASDGGAAPERHAKRLAEVLPIRHLRVLADAGHQIPYLHPDALVTATDWVLSQGRRTETVN